MKKKFSILSIMILLITVLLCTNVYAETLTSATIAITSSKTEYESSETVEFIISLKDLEASNGIIALGAYVEYDSNLLTLNTNAEGLSGWVNAEVFEGTHRFATTKNTTSSNNEDIIKITFTAKDVTNDAETSISLKRIEISNGVEYDINESTSNKIIIKPKSSSSLNPPTGGSEDESENSSNQNNNSNNQNNNPNGSNNLNNSHSNNSSNKPNSSVSNNTLNSNSTSNLPQTGFSNEYLLVTIVTVIIIATILFMKIMILNKKKK